MNSQILHASAGDLDHARLGALVLVLSLGLQGCSGADADRSAEHGAIVAASRPTAAVMPHRQVAGYGNLPIRFEPNVGQAPPPIKYLARGDGYALAVTEQGAVLSLRQGASPQNGPRSAASTRTPAASLPPALLSLHPVHAGAKPALRAELQQNSVSNYFIGNDPSKWHSNVANYAAVRYEQIYPGIDWVMYGNPRQLEYDFVVAPRADPRQIELDIEGARSISVDGNGDLLIKVHDRILRQLRPVIYQTAADGARHEIDGHYVVSHRHFAFALGDYDHSRQLVIDPAFVYSTYLGGSGRDAAAAIAVDSEGNAYVAGVTFSTDFPIVNPFQATNHSASTDSPGNAFVTKFNPAGSEPVYSTYLGGSGTDAAYGIAVDGAGNAYVVGSTTSVDFPTVAPFQATNHAGYPASFPSNAFVTKLNAAGSALVYSTYLGGSGPGLGDATFDCAYAIAVDSAGNAYVAGRTASTDFPTVDPFQATYNGGGSAIGSNAFVAKFNAAGSTLLYSTYLGGSGSNAALGIAVDNGGSAYVAGSTSATDFPTAAPFQATNKAGTSAGFPVNYLSRAATAFLTKFNAAGSALVYSTYLGGSGSDGAGGVAVDSDGNAYVAGVTSSTDFPTVNPFQATNHSTASMNAFNAFVAKFNAAGSGLVYSTYLGGSNSDGGNAIAVDSSGNAYVTGVTSSPDFPLANPLQDMNNGTANGAADAFVSVLNTTGSALVFSTYLGGSGSASAAQRGDIDSAAAIAVDSKGDLYVTGVTYSTNFPTAAAYQGTNKATSGGTAFVTKIAMQSGPPPPSGGGGMMGWGLIATLGFAVAMRCRKRRNRPATGIAIGAPLAAALLLVGCGGGSTQNPPGGTPNGTSLNTNATPSAVALAQMAGTPVDPAIVAADNGFGLGLLDTLLPGSDGGNIAISPISIALALQILYNGAAGPTQRTMAGTLQLGALTDQALNSDNAALQASLINADPKVQLTIANSIWVDQSGSPVLPSFTQIDETYYGATVGDLAGAPADVNAWVDGETHGLITELMPPGEYRDAIIANVLYFKGQWTTSFDPSDTATASFTLSDGSRTSTELMHQTGSLAYAAGTLHGDNFQAVRIPYGQGRLSMLIILPDTGANVANFVADITIDDLNRVIAQLQPSMVTVALPRFTASYGTSLTGALASMGMGIAFSPSADYSALAPGFSVNVVEHKTVVEVDETGTVAAAATGVGDTAVVSPQYTITIDHPFFYAIRDDETGELLFIGVLMSPS